MATKAKRTEAGEVAGPREGRRGGRGGIRRATRAEALAIIFATAIRDDEGFRHGALGKPRMGKTFHLKDVVWQAVDQGIADVALIHDCKRQEVQYDGVAFGSAAEFRGFAPDQEPFAVFHGEVEACSVDDVAALGLMLGRGGVSNVVLIDELYHGIKGRQAFEGRAFARILREGSSQRVSSAWTTQIPQALPTEPIDLTETISLFCMSGRSRNYIVDSRGLPGEAADIMSRLERGEFILSTDDDWDRTVYGPT